MNKRYQVFVSSTYADLKDERAKVMQTIMELDCIPAGMELFPAIDEEQLEFIKRIIDDCDYYILIIGGRYGSLSEDGISYTEKEYDYAIAKEIKVMAFIHSHPDEITFSKSEKDSELRQKLENFKKKVATNRLIKFWKNSGELPGLVSLSLSKMIKTYPAVGWIRGNTSTDPEVYKRLSELQNENQKLKQLEMSNDNCFDDLAGMEDTIKISGISTRYNDHRFDNESSPCELTLSWNKIFSLLSPYLLSSPSDISTKGLLNNILKDFINQSSPVDYVEIRDQDFQTIKIHLKALGLIIFQSTKTNKEGYLDLSWSLTEKGESLMMKLRSIRK
jgi:hypothetical protein